MYVKYTCNISIFAILMILIPGSLIYNVLVETHFLSFLCVVKIYTYRKRLLFC